MELPTTWFSNAPGSLSQSEVRLFALLLLHHHMHAEDAVLDEWIQQAFASAGSTDVDHRLSYAAKQRGRCLKLAENALAGVPGGGGRSNRGPTVERRSGELPEPARPGFKESHGSPSPARPDQALRRRQLLTIFPRSPEGRRAVERPRSRDVCGCSHRAY